MGAKAYAESEISRISGIESGLGGHRAMGLFRRNAADERIGVVRYWFYFRRLTGQRFDVPADYALKEEIGMETARYFMAFLWRGSAWTANENPELEQLQNAHLGYIEEMRDTGKLILAGPFTDDGDLRGLFLFDVNTVEEAQALCEEDPMVRVGHLRYEIHPWMTGAHDL